MRQGWFPILSGWNRHERGKLCASKDIEGVVGARLIVLMLTDPDPNYPYRRTSGELGPL